MPGWGWVEQQQEQLLMCKSGKGFTSISLCYIVSLSLLSWLKECLLVVGRDPTKSPRLEAGHRRRRRKRTARRTTTSLNSRHSFAPLSGSKLLGNHLK